MFSIYTFKKTNNKDADQTARTCSLISVFVVRIQLNTIKTCIAHTFSPAHISQKIPDHLLEDEDETSFCMMWLFSN